MKNSFFIGIISLTILLIAAGCTAQTTAVAHQPTATNTPAPNPTGTAVPSDPTHIVTAPAPTLTPIPTSSATAVPTATPTPSLTPSPTPIGPCSQRSPHDDLLAVVSKNYGLSRDFAPTDLVLITDYFGPEVTLGYPTEIRAIVLEPLTRLIQEMQTNGLQPQIISGYRSYSAQAIAYDKWVLEFPDRANILSAPPGYSEHQLGTTIDFGSPSLPEITGDPELQFHTYFYQTPEGTWLLENAHRYGFTLSYPRESFDLTGFYYEPWHFRYVGVETATMLYETNTYLTAYQLSNQTEPCLP